MLKRTAFYCQMNFVGFLGAEAESLMHTKFSDIYIDTHKYTQNTHITMYKCHTQICICVNT